MAETRLDCKRLAAAIEDMTDRLRGAAKPAAVRTDGQPGLGLGWWLLLCGQPLAPNNFCLREAARKELEDHAKDLGLADEEFTWVWDETNRAQLVVGHYPSLDKAQRALERETARLEARVQYGLHAGEAPPRLLFRVVPAWASG